MARQEQAKQRYDDLPMERFWKVPQMLEQAQPIGTIRQYGDFITVARARMQQLGITFETLDAISGVQSGYSAKLLGPTPSKKFGPISFTAIMGALGIQLEAVDDQAALERIRSRLVTRKVARQKRHWRHRCPEMTAEGISRPDSEITVSEQNT